MYALCYHFGRNHRHKQCNKNALDFNIHLDGVESRYPTLYEVEKACFVPANILQIYGKTLNYGNPL